MSKSPSNIAHSHQFTVSLVAAPARKPLSCLELCLVTVPHGICGLYERKLKELNPAIRNITYDIADLYNFIDGLADMSALVTKVALCSDFKRIATIVVCSYYSLMEVLPCPGRLMVILGSDDENEKETTGKYGLLSIVARLAPQAQ
ncbi:uncharacterized protein LOC122316587 isoform X2 [Carya illinoinensis]|uniref:uncharacterized protein LOC122316587 isoform X2 n=1 Tax=Carya illinoinensis TaxID=32201 RepID=UPI001C720BF2|nr:uncharacterized protein LOC122316587 isoform X2 [Carya illinoinensis]